MIFKVFFFNNILSFLYEDEYIKEINICEDFKNVFCYFLNLIMNFMR